MHDEAPKTSSVSWNRRRATHWTGPDGLLASAGLVPLDAQERAAQRHELTANDD